MSRDKQLGMALTAAILACAPVTSKAGSDCKLVAIELPITMSNNRPLIPSSVNGQPVKMLLDTGAAQSIIFRSAAAALKLSVHLTGRSGYGVDGSEALGTVTVADFGLGQTKVRNVEFYATGPRDAPVNDVSVDSIVGLLGEDVLSHWDLDLDLPNGKVRLMTPQNCKDDQVVYWSRSYAALPLIHAPSGWLWSSVQINGHQMVGMFDTGAGRSVVATRSLRLAGVEAETEISPIGKVGGVAGKPMQLNSAIFPTLSLGQESVKNARLQIADLFERDKAVLTGSLIPKGISEFPDMLIGADFFLAHHVYFARRQDKIYFTYEGGPIFQPPPKEVENPAEAVSKH